jgi:hypothetical protein
VNCANSCAQSSGGTVGGPGGLWITQINSTSPPKNKDGNSFWQQCAARCCFKLCAFCRRCYPWRPICGCTWCLGVSRQNPFWLSITPRYPITLIRANSQGRSLAAKASAEALLTYGRQGLLQERFRRIRVPLCPLTDDQFDGNNLGNHMHAGTGRHVRTIAMECMQINCMLEGGERIFVRILTEPAAHNRYKSHVSKPRDSGFHATPRIEPCLNNLKVFVTERFAYLSRGVTEFSYPRGTPPRARHASGGSYQVSVFTSAPVHDYLTMFYW